MVRRALVAAAALLAAGPVLAQSADPVFLSGWTWSPETLAAEATGLGGAFTATVRGQDALYWSPAALTFDSGLDVRASLGARPGLGVVLHGNTVHVGFGVRRTYSRTRHGDGWDSASQVFEVGQLRLVLDQAALGAAVRRGRLRIGAALLAGPLAAEGAWSRAEAGATPSQAAREVRYDYTGLGEWQVGAASSAIWEVLGTHPMARDQLRIGAAMRWPTLGRTPHYRLSRLVLRNPSPLSSPDAAGVFEGLGPDRQAFRLPRAASVGAEARISVFSPTLRTLRVAAGATWTDYNAVLDTARGNSGDAALPLTLSRVGPWEVGGGVEGTFPLFRLRIGVRERPGHDLVLAVPSSGRSAVATFGLSHDLVVGGKRLQIDFDSINTFDDLVLSTRLLW
jgi:hypothetical protein